MLDWPSLVIEVGVFESLGALRCDTHFWIFHSDGMTRIVILIAVDVESKFITIERWGHVPAEHLSHVVGHSIQSRKVQSVTINDSGVVNGAPLDIPASLIFDVGSIPIGVQPTDFSFRAHELSAFCEEFWSMVT